MVRICQDEKRLGRNQGTGKKDEDREKEINFCGKRTSVRWIRYADRWAGTSFKARFST